ncbi:helix-turn-helix transcriptional regulator [Photobacterium sp. SDRW27]|uniref:AraC family transcriptional regulator n=1 Tax=Photobacterium obscurum TaxID=2829490 RepID=UPI0022433711|nr:helix-turn-helix transcriptional regulator [Photobacterium obscurum]MCW8328414.1 helix-turn-helix transcriptional regulator [Photobacterium obscurum]
MAQITEQDRFNPDQIDNTVVGIAADIGRHDSGMHHHQKAQLLYAPAGCMSITLSNMQCVLPPTRAAWIPAGIEHCAVMRNVVAYRSIYFDTDCFQHLPNELKVLSVNGLLRELIERMAFWPWDMPSQEQQALLALFWQELKVAPEETLTLPKPQDHRLQEWLKAIEQHNGIPPSLNQTASMVGASDKTISRIFSRETGMPYQSWRQQWRLMKAIELLAENTSITDVAFQLEFSSDSAFISFFRQHTGETPHQYLRSIPK